MPEDSIVIIQQIKGGNELRIVFPGQVELGIPANGEGGARGGDKGGGRLLGVLRNAFDHTSPVQRCSKAAHVRRGEPASWAIGFEKEEDPRHVAYEFNPEEYSRNGNAHPKVSIYANPVISRAMYMGESDSTASQPSKPR